MPVSEDRSLGSQRFARLAWMALQVAHACLCVVYVYVNVKCVCLCVCVAVCGVCVCVRVCLYVSVALWLSDVSFIARLSNI